MTNDKFSYQRICVYIVTSNGCCRVKQLANILNIKQLLISLYKKMESRKEA